jgi:transcriptional regulator of acetoin/glycerol metabolism
VTDQGQENFNAGLHEWLKRNNDLHHQFEILGTDWEEAYNGTCGEGTSVPKISNW